jgi:tRNA threonylcarbamoyladenosine biosynthesis protein TsaB
MGYLCQKNNHLPFILNIETSTKNCSVSISKDGALISLKEINNGNYSHAEMLHPLIVDVLKESGTTIDQLSAVAVGKGPGSYTGLRIGVSAAKGLCFTHDLPLIAINSLEILSHTCKSKEGIIIPMIDARRMEVYSMIFDKSHNSLRETKAEIITEDSFLEYLEKDDVYFLGDGAEKCKDILTHKNAHFIDNMFPSAKEMALLSYNKFKKNNIENVAYFEPFYLKNFIATQEKKKS